jgi:hypothetical protein
VATENKDQELETASVTLAEGMHFAGAIDGFHIDLDAEEYAGGTGPSPTACCSWLWPVAQPWT